MAAESIKIQLSAQDNASRVIRQTEASLKGLSNQVTRTNVSTKGVSTGFTTIGRSAGQAGLQIQQLVGQIQGGTNPMLALSQQSADLGFVLGAPLVGAVVGLTASLAMSLVPALFETSKSAQDLIKDIDELRARTGQLTDAQKALIQQNRAEQIRAERAEVNKLTSAIESNQRAAMALRQAQQDAEMDVEAAGIVDYEGKIEELYQKRITLSGELANAEQRLRLLEAGRTEEGDKFILNLQKEVDLLGKSRTEAMRYEAARLGLSDAQRKQLDLLIKEIELHEKNKDMMAESQTIMGGISGGMKAYGDSIKSMYEELAGVSQRALKSMEDAFVDLAMTGKFNFKDMANSIVADLIRIQVRQSMLSVIGGGGGGISGFFSGVGDLFGGFFANGGTPPANKVSVVGERGPELFVPPAAGGTIVPMGAGGSQPVHITYNIQSWDSRDTMMAIQQSAPQIVGIVQNAFNKRGRRGPMG